MILDPNLICIQWQYPRERLMSVYMYIYLDRIYNTHPHRGESQFQTRTRRGRRSLWPCPPLPDRILPNDRHALPGLHQFLQSSVLLCFDTPSRFPTATTFTSKFIYSTVQCLSLIHLLFSALLPRSTLLSGIEFGSSDERRGGRWCKELLGGEHARCGLSGGQSGFKRGGGDVGDGGDGCFGL